MNNIVIDFNKVSKKFAKGQKLYLKQALLDIFRSEKQEEFWALKDISFKLERGQSLGIIGVNGSGKSTLLKLIAGVINPTKGEVKVMGRIGPLIELGAGFHPELSGRDNIYLNGTILGLTKKEIDEKFEIIVKFSELEEFIDTPVKHYSSGMYMRLGFSIAIHSNPELLLIDEILAVGDVAFQRKCLDKIREMKASGVTLVFVSHSIELVKGICDKVILLQKGKLIEEGEPSKITGDYLIKTFKNNENVTEETNERRWGDGNVKVISTNILKKSNDIKISIKAKFEIAVSNPIFGITIRSESNQQIMVSNTSWKGIKTGEFKKGESRIITWEIPNIFENGKYFISPAVAYSDGVSFYDWRENYVSFLIDKPQLTGGILNFDHNITIKK